MAQFIEKTRASKDAPRLDPRLPRDFCERFPALAEYLVSGMYVDDSPRQRSTITVMAGDADGFKAVLNDRDNARSLWATAQTLDGVFVSLEAMLCSGNAPWRADRQEGKKK